MPNFITRTAETPRLRAECRSQFAAGLQEWWAARRLPAARPPTRTHMDLLTWIIVGMIAGLIASALVGGIGFGLLGDIVVGMVGALVGGWLFSTLRIATPMGGAAGNILVAFVGALVLLVLFRFLKPGRRFV